MTDLERCIQHWERLRSWGPTLMEPSVIYWIDQTIKSLKELQKLKEEHAKPKS